MEKLSHQNSYENVTNNLLHDFLVSPQCSADTRSQIKLGNYSEPCFELVNGTNTYGGMGAAYPSMRFYTDGSVKIMDCVNSDQVAVFEKAQQEFDIFYASHKTPRSMLLNFFARLKIR